MQGRDLASCWPTASSPPANVMHSPHSGPESERGQMESVFGLNLLCVLRDFKATGVLEDQLTRELITSISLTEPKAGGGRKGVKDVTSLKPITAEWI